MSRKRTIEKNIRASHEASKSSRYMQSGLSDKRAKLSSKNFDKLMAERGLSKEDAAGLKASNQPGTSTEVRHAKAGEKFVTTHGSEHSSGVFVSEKSFGNTPIERIDKGALPHSNSAEYETTVEQSRNQYLVYGKLAPQSKFVKWIHRRNHDLEVQSRLLQMVVIIPMLLQIEILSVWYQRYSF